MIFFDAIGEVTLSVWSAEIGATVVVPDWVAATSQFPAFLRRKALPCTSHTEGLLLSKVTGDPLDAVAVKFTVPAVNETVAGSVNEIVCAVREISKIRVYMSEAKYSEVDSEK